MFRFLKTGQIFFDALPELVVRVLHELPWDVLLVSLPVGLSHFPYILNVIISDPRYECSENFNFYGSPIIITKFKGSFWSYGRSFTCRMMSPYLSSRQSWSNYLDLWSLTLILYPPISEKPAPCPEFWTHWWGSCFFGRPSGTSSRDHLSSKKNNWTFSFHLPPFCYFLWMYWKTFCL